jgi:hypothetical protein
MRVSSVRRKFKEQGDLRFWMLKLHLYGGLLCSSHLILFGLSSLYFNHGSFFGSGEPEPVTWSYAVTVPALDGEMPIAEQFRDNLGLFSWPLPWVIYRDNQQDLHFDLANPILSMA